MLKHVYIFFVRHAYSWIPRLARRSGACRMNRFDEYFGRLQHLGESQKLGPDLDAKRTRLTMLI
jgi:hypothetical protein